MCEIFADPNRLDQWEHRILEVQVRSGVEWAAWAAWVNTDGDNFSNIICNVCGIIMQGVFEPLSLHGRWHITQLDQDYVAAFRAMISLVGPCETVLAFRGGDRG